MKPRRTHNSTNVYRLLGGNEDNDLWVETTEDGGGNLVLASVWQPSEAERELIACGANIELLIWGVQPPVAIRTTNVKLGKKPDA